MKPAPAIRGLIWPCALLLRVASLLVPRLSRKNWYLRWYADIWHWAHFLYESGQLNAFSKLELARHCWGAFPDAFWRRFDKGRFMDAMHELPRSPRFCLGAISSVLLAALLLSGLAPTIRASLAPLPYFQPKRVAQLSFPGSFSRYHDGVIFNSATSWSRHSHTAKAVASYSFGSTRVEGSKFSATSARVSPNFFELLGVRAAQGRLFQAGDERNCKSCVVITRQFWKSWFHGDPGIIGRKITFAGVQGQVIGVLPANFGFIFPEPPIWALPPTNVQSSNFVDKTGAVLRLADGATVSQAEEEFRGFVSRDDSSFSKAKPQVSLMASRPVQSAKVYLLFSLISLVGGLALASARLAAARTRKLHLGPRDVARWWSFLTVKTILLLSICLVVSLELTARIFVGLTGAIDPMVVPLSTWLFLATGMAALSWSLHDQGRRCRVCLKRLSHEASVGAPSYLLLDWWGTELVCSQGHGLLHVPEMKASWMEFEQWLHLDESWKPLFESKKDERPAHLV